MLCALLFLFGNVVDAVDVDVAAACCAAIAVCVVGVLVLVDGVVCDDVGVL